MVCISRAVIVELFHWAVQVGLCNMHIGLRLLGSLLGTVTGFWFLGSYVVSVMVVYQLLFWLLVGCKLLNAIIRWQLSEKIIQLDKNLLIDLSQSTLSCFTLICSC